MNTDTPKNVSSSVGIIPSLSPSICAPKNAAYAAHRAVRLSAEKCGRCGRISCDIAITIPATPSIIKESRSCWLSTTAAPSQ